MITHRKAGRDGLIGVNQDMVVFVGKLGVGDRVRHTIETGRHAWLPIAECKLELTGLPWKGDDGAAVSEASGLTLVSAGPAQLMLIDLN